MDVTLNDAARKKAILSIERYFAENMDERIGNIAAAAMLGFFIEEIGPAIYNQAISDVQERLQQRVMEVDIELHAEEFDYWRKYDQPRKRR